MNQAEQGKEINQANAPASDAVEVTATGELSDRDLDEVAGAGLASIPVGNIINMKVPGVPVLNINDTELD